MKKLIILLSVIAIFSVKLTANDLQLTRDFDIIIVQDTSLRYVQAITYDDLIKKLDNDLIYYESASKIKLTINRINFDMKIWGLGILLLIAACTVMILFLKD